MKEQIDEYRLSLEELKASLMQANNENLKIQEERNKDDIKNAEKMA